MIIATAEYSYPYELYELWDYDISTDEIERIFYNDDAKEIHGVSIWDEKVSYVHENQVFVYDLNTKITQKITSVSSEKMYTAIYEDKVVWSDERNGNFDIYMYDLSTSTETQITSDTKDDWKPDIYGDYVAWIRGYYSGSPQDIYLYKLS